MPVWILARPDLGANAKVVYAVIEDAMRGKQEAYPGQERIARFIGASVRTVARAIKELARRHLLQVDRRQHGRFTVYRLSKSPATLTGQSETLTRQNGSSHQTECPVPPDNMSGHSIPSVLTDERNRRKKQTRKKSRSEPDSWEFAEDLIPLGSPLKRHRFQAAWEEWAAHRRQIHKKLTECTVKRQLKKCVKWGLDGAVAAIERSIEKGWTGLFEPREESKRANPAKLVAEPGKYDNVGGRVGTG